MNINLVVDPNTPTIPDHENIILNDITNIPTTSCQSVVMNNVINYLSDEHIATVLEKIRHNGTITISSIDANLLASSFYRNDIDLNAFSNFVRGSYQQHTLIEMRNMFESRGYTIESASITDNLSFYLKVKRL